MKFLKILTGLSTFGHFFFVFQEILGYFSKHFGDFRDFFEELLRDFS